MVAVNDVLAAVSYGPADDAFLRGMLPDASFMEQATRRLWTELTGGHSVTKPRGNRSGGRRSGVKDSLRLQGILQCAA